MNIKIEQTLHGYQNGHQLLMSSSQLSSEARKTLLIQSDLSGSNIDEDFKIYISGYPLVSHYAFSKTWYADEMRRPGCVWTHTLLISFADLGKIPDLDQLLDYFIRPVKDQYDQYGYPISINKEELKNSERNFDDFAAALPLLDAVYNHNNRTIIYPSYRSVDFEKVVVQLWSSQWPRLRRNFSFCTGALSLKVLDGAEFDLQIVPLRNIISVEKQTLKGFIAQDDNNNIKTKWFNLLDTPPKDKLRKFLWYYGSDIKGSRKNYKTLLRFFGLSQATNTEFRTVSNLLVNAFETNEGQLLKNDIYNDGSLFAFDEKEVLNHLTSNADIDYIDKNYIKERLLKALKTDKISVNDFIDFYINAIPERIDQDIWQNIAVNASDIVSLIVNDSRFIAVFAEKIPGIATLDETWQLPIETQTNFIRLLEDSSDVNWEAIITSILKAKSRAIFYLLRNYNYYKIYAVIRCINNDNSLSSQELLTSVFSYKTVIKNFVRENISSLTNYTCVQLFQFLNYTELVNIGLEGVQWQQVYRKITYEQTKISAACVLLSFGFSRKVSNPAVLVAECFSDVYYYAKNAKIEPKTWQFVPIDVDEIEDDKDAFSIFFSYINLFPPKKANVPKWDYCELLVRTLVNKFIKYNWSQQYFLDSLKTDELLISAISYAVGFKKGFKFLRDLIENINRRKVTVRKNQLPMIDILRKEFRR